MPGHDVSAIAEGIWQTYTPVWGSSGTQPALGNGTLTGRYSILGKTCFAFMELTIGSTTTFGTGDYTLSLPFNNPSGYLQLSSVAIDASPSQIFGGEGRISGGLAVLLNQAAPSLGWGPSIPMTWANGDIARVSAIFEVT